ncbi:MAG: hypothetical protein IJ785_00415 [Bacteroidales bacterium]|nr:hypothetical protein [Bacteroidales bacterium]
MKRTALFTLMMVLLAAAHCQDTVSYPYPAYMEWPRDSMLAVSEPFYLHTSNSAISIMGTQVWDPYTREFVVDTPTTIYGIAGMFWRQNELKKNFRVLLLSTRNKFQEIHLVKSVKWNDKLPMCYVKCDASWCGYPGAPEGEVHDYVTTYEFYFDEPVVVTDTFLVGFQSLGNDGQFHIRNSLSEDSLNTLYLCTQQGCCDHTFRKPVWRRLTQDIFGSSDKCVVETQ